jgi:hypothetical protein
VSRVRGGNWRLVIAAGVLIGACAKQEPPGGGPPDLVPPRISSSVPDSGSANVLLEAPLAVTFTENMEPRSTGDAVTLAPHVEIRRRRWKARTISLDLAEPLRPNQTYTMFVGTAARDRHGNPLANGQAIVFSTGDSFPRGRIQGEIAARGFQAQGTYVWCYDAAHPGPDSTARDFEALGQADREGRFQVDGLNVPGQYRVWAFVDLNGNRSYEPTADILAPFDSTLALTPEAPVSSGFKVNVLNPRAPGRVRGTVIDSTQITTGALRVVAISEKDTTRSVVADAGAANAFEFQLDSGGWMLRAFRDVDGNKFWHAQKEPASRPLRLEVGPADDIVDIKLEIVPASGGVEER